MPNPVVVEALKKTGRVARDAGVGTLLGGVSGALWSAPFAVVDAVQEDPIAEGALNTIGTVALGAGGGAAIGSAIDQVRGQGRTSLRLYGQGTGALVGIVGSAIAAFKSGEATETDAAVIEQAAEESGMSAGELLALGGVAGLGVAASHSYIDGDFDSTRPAAPGTYEDPAVTIVDIVPVKEAKTRAQARKRGARS